MQGLKQCFGIDVAKDFFVVRFGQLQEDFDIKISKERTFNNNLKGFVKFQSFIETRLVGDLPHSFVLEATGVYYEYLAYYLLDKGYAVSVLLPTQAKNFARSLEWKSKTDAIDAAILTRLGLERKLKLWSPPSELMLELKMLTRERQDMKKKVVSLKNQLHAKLHTYRAPKSSISRLRRQLRFYDKLILQVEVEIKELIESDLELDAKFKAVCSIKGVKIVTAAIVVSETNGFALVKNQKQLASYAGLDVKFNQSGLSKGKCRLSKKGNANIRRALFMPSMTASSLDTEIGQFYLRVIDGKPSKKIGILAVARKLLLLIYSIWKSGKQYDPFYLKNQPLNP